MNVFHTLMTLAEPCRLPRISHLAVEFGAVNARFKGMPSGSASKPAPSDVVTGIIGVSCSFPWWTAEAILQQSKVRAAERDWPSYLPLSSTARPLAGNIQARSEMHARDLPGKFALYCFGATFATEHRSVDATRFGQFTG